MERASGVYAKCSMITYKEALKKILEHSQLLKVGSVPLREGLGRILGKDIVAPEPFPSFDNSAVDGYAISVPSHMREGKKIKLKVQGEIRAGQRFKGFLKPGHAIRIFTGASVPKGTQAVAMQEHVERVNGHIFLSKKPEREDNIRFRGEDFQKGKILARRNTLLAPTHLALLAAVGCEKIPVRPSPKVAILATGSELLAVGEKLMQGKIRDSNTILLEALVKEVGGISFSFSSVGDDPKKIRSWIQKGLNSDMLLISGGVSVGKYDFVKEILKQEGVKEIFWKVNIKPGKPLFFGKKNQTLVFGLPGNPVSVFVTFEEFVKPAIFRMEGKVQQEDKWIKGYLTKPFRNGSRFHFVRVRCHRKKTGYTITPLKGQGSHMIGSLACANALLRVEANANLKKNACVSVKLIGKEKRQ